MRRAAKKDDNHTAVVDRLRSLPGVSVDIINGKGTPDLLVGVDLSNILVGVRLNLLFEVKDGAKVESKRRLTEAQVTWHRDWKGQKVIVESPDEAEQYVKDYTAALIRMCKRGW